MDHLNAHPPLRGVHMPHSTLLSLTRPNRTMFEKQRALLRKAVPAGFPLPADDYVERRLRVPKWAASHLI